VTKINTLANGQLCYASFKKIESGRPLIVLLPGGPSISGEYMGQMLRSLSAMTDINTLLLYLPNHDCSYSSFQKGQFGYEKAVGILTDGIKELRDRSGPITLIGHSFGARVTFDISSKVEAGILKNAIMISMPYTFEVPLKYKNAANDLTGPNVKTETNEEFRAFWNKILPLHFLDDIPKKQRNILTSSVFWVGNEAMDVNVPLIDESAERLKNRNLPILFLDSSSDLRLPEDNPDWIERNFPGKRVEIGNSSHFPMLENEEDTIEQIKIFLEGRGKGAI
jgi:pimeloyl-ACP methyl ester carboxylesterase